MLVADFDFTLPDRLIATRPASPRDSARLLVVQPDSLGDRVVRDLPTLLRPGDLLVFNDTRVIPARLYGQRGEVKVETLLHKQVDLATWEAYARPGKRLKIGQTITYEAGLTAEVQAKNPDDGTITLRFNLSGEALQLKLIDIGHMPLPPYIERAADSDDNETYQTIFAREAGAVAAPTASLHYTEELLTHLKAAGIDWCTITLHVGAGTFMPMRVDNTEDHIMHAERYEISADAADKINAVKAAGGRIIPVGTTALRTLEAVASTYGAIQPASGETRLFITPGFQFKVADLLLTNFHLPKSTLLMLVSAFSGMDRIRQAYAHAIAEDYRFYSYGDTCLLYPQAA